MIDLTGVMIGNIDVGLAVTGVLAFVGAVTTIGATVAHFTATDKDDKFFAKMSEFLSKVNTVTSPKKIVTNKIADIIESEVNKISEDKEPKK